MTVIYAVILFVILIFPHELGHFAVAKAVGVKVNEFSFGMGPALFKKQKGETLYAVRAIPIGGYCALEGENEESDNSRAFNNKPGWAKIAVLLAGSAMNILIVLIVMSILTGIAGTPTVTIDKVQSNSPAYVAGVKAGDKILEVNGESVSSWNDLSEKISKSKKSLNLEVSRDGNSVSMTITPKSEDGRYIIGITPVMKHNVFTAVKDGAVGTWNLTKTMYKSLEMLITGEVSAKEMSGPVGMITLVSKTSDYGLQYFLYLLALISLNLAVINLLPLPALDGGRILFVIIRKITGTMITDNIEGKVHAVGMVLLIGLMVFVTWNDIARWLT